MESGQSNLLKSALRRFAGGISQRGFSKITAAQRRRSVLCAYVSSIAAVIGANCIGGGVLNLLAIKLGASEFFLGLLGFFAIAPFLFGLFTMSAIERFGKRLVAVSWFFASSFFVIPFMLLPVFLNKFGWSSKMCLFIILVVTFLRTATTSMGVTGWFPLLQDVVPRKITGRFFGRLRTAWQGAGFLFLIGAALFLGPDARWWKFEVLFILGFALLMIRALVVIPMAEKPPAKADQAAQRIISRIAEIWKIKPLRLVAVYIFIYSVAVTASVPFIIKMMKDFGYSDGIVLAALSMASLGAIVSLNRWGRLADTFGNRAIFSLSHVGVMVCTFLWILFEKSGFGTVLAFALFFISSVFHSGNGIAQTRYLFHAIPDHKQNYITIINTIANFGAAVGPLIAGAFLWATKGERFSSGAVDMNNYHVLFILNAALFIVPHVLRKSLRIKKELPTNQVITIMARPLRNIVGPFVSIASSGGSRRIRKRKNNQETSDGEKENDSSCM